MKCVVLRGKNEKKIEQDVNNWFNNHPNANIKFVTQAGPSSTAVITTIFYEE